MEVRGKGSTVRLDRDKEGKLLSNSKCRNWELRVSVGKKKSTGKYPPMTRRFHGTYTEAQAALRKFIEEIQSDAVTHRSKVLFGEYADAYLEDRKKTSPYGTWTKNEYQLKNAKLHLANARMDEITPRDLEDAYRALMDGESVSGRKLSGTTVAGIATTLHTMFKTAVRDGELASNPCDSAWRPSEDTVERESIRADRIRELVGKLDPSKPSQFVIRAILKNGFRRGEVHGLSAKDLDFVNHVAHVRNSYDNGGNLKASKTTAGIRDIPMTPSFEEDAKARLRAIRDDLRKAREKHGREGFCMSPDTPLVCDNLGKRLLPNVTTRWWGRNRAALGFPNLTVHEMRHSFLSEMARRKTDLKVLQKLAGHAKASTTMDIYTHVDLEDKREAMKAVDW